MPLKSTISHRGDIFDSLTTMCCKRDLNAVYGHSPCMRFLGFDCVVNLTLTLIFLTIYQLFFEGSVLYERILL